MRNISLFSRTSVAAACIAATLHHGALACSAIDIVAADKPAIAGRAMEWAFDMQWKVLSLPKGTTLTLDAPPGLKLPAVPISG